MADTETRTPTILRTKNSSFDEVAKYYGPALNKVTKFLSYVLRHGPDTIGVTMDANGWVSVEELIHRSADHRPLSRSLIHYAVAENDKQRFALSEDGDRIRAKDGHSVKVDLGLEPRQPPANLFHGTSTYNVKAILKTGLRPIGRTHVHLSADHDTAASSGGRLVCRKVLVIDSAAMAAEGHVFQLSENGTWLTGPVPPKYLTTAD